MESIASSISRINTSCDLHLQPFLYVIDLQYLLNSNAYKYSPEDSLVDIRTLSETEKNNAQRMAARVTNHGVGMTTDQTGQIFEKFHQVNSAPDTLGSRPEMSIEKKIIDLYKGEVAIISSVASGGTSITVLFPKSKPLPLQT
jgi:signal transduction histidine kinase